MGPSGCGKSTVAAALSSRMAAAKLLEADDFHSDEARAKMESGQPLTDADRVPWIERIRSEISAQDVPVILLACSALTPFVQRRLSDVHGRQTRFICLNVPRDVLVQRVRARQGHFMPAALVDSQIDALDCPDDAFVVEADQPIEAVVDAIFKALKDKTQ